MARAFSVHTVGGTLGWAIAPVLVAGIAALASWRVALLLVSGCIGLGLAALVLANRALLETPGHRDPSTWPPVPRSRATCALFSSAPILLCFAFFALQATSFIALQGFMPLSLHQLFGLDMVAATATVTAFMIGSAAGTHGRRGRWPTAAAGTSGSSSAGLALAAVILFLIGRIELPTPVLLAAVALAGALAGPPRPRATCWCAPPRRRALPARCSASSIPASISAPP